MDFQCVYCRSFCPTYCYPTHRQDFSCHNTRCLGHPPVDPPFSSPYYEQYSSMSRSVYTQTREGEPSRGLAGGQDRVEFAAPRTPRRPPPPPPLPPLPPLPPHIQYFLQGLRSPRDPGAAPRRPHDDSFTRRPKGHEYRRGRWRPSQAGPVWNQSAVQMLQDQPSLSRIKRGLYVGNLACVETPGLLESMNITAVVSVLSRRPGGHPSHPLNRAIPFEDQLFLRVRDELDQDLLQHFPGVCDFIDKRLSPNSTSHFFESDDTDNHYSPDEQPRPFIPSTDDDNDYDEQPVSLRNQRRRHHHHRVLIHCHAGVSRSVAVAAAYLMYKRRQPVRETMQAIRRARPVARPNESFLAQLRLWWDLRFRLYRIPEFRVPCEEYEDLQRRWLLRG